jgi:hypothetical protein
MPHAPAGPGAFPPDEQLAVLSIATSTTRSHDRPVNGWTLDEIAATILNQAHAQAISRATVWRILDRADLKPHRSVYFILRAPTADARSHWRRIYETVI